MKTFLLGFAMLFVGFTATAQDQEWGPEWGDTPEKRLEHVHMLNFMRDHISREEWGPAGYYLHVLTTEVPTAHPRMYSMGIDMYGKRARATTDPAQKRVFADSMIMLSERYIALFSEKYPAAMPALWNNRAVYTRQYFGEDKARVAKAFKEGYQAAGASMPGLVVGYFGELTASYLREELSAEDYLAAYDKLSGELAVAENAEDQQRQLEKLFADSGAASCENIENIYGKHIAENPSDTLLLDRTLALLNNRDCRGEFYYSVAEKYYQLKPTALTARVLAASYKAKGDNATAARFIGEALTLASTPKEKFDVLIGVAAEELMDNNYRGAYNHAQQAVQIDPKSASALYFVAVSTAGGAGGCSGLSRSAALWLAYDRMLQARAAAVADPEIKPDMMKNIESSMARFSSGFPATEELFLEGLNPGDGYTVNCGWVSGRTTVRPRP